MTVFSILTGIRLLFRGASLYFDIQEENERERLRAGYELGLEKGLDDGEIKANLHQLAREAECRNAGVPYRRYESLAHEALHIAEQRGVPPHRLDREFPLIVAELKRKYNRQPEQ